MFFSTEMERGMGGGFERDLHVKADGNVSKLWEPLGRGVVRRPHGPHVGRVNPQGQAHPDVGRFLGKSAIFLKAFKKLYVF